MSSVFKSMLNFFLMCLHIIVSVINYINIFIVMKNVVVYTLISNAMKIPS